MWHITRDGKTGHCQMESVAERHLMTIASITLQAVWLMQATQTVSDQMYSE